MIKRLRVGIGIFLIIVSLLLISTLQDMVNRKEITGRSVLIVVPIVALFGLVIGAAIFIWMFFYPQEKKSKSEKLLRKE